MRLIGIYIIIIIIIINIIFSCCRSTMWIIGKKGATQLEDAVVSNIDREVMNMFQSVSIL